MERQLQVPHTTRRLSLLKPALGATGGQACEPQDMHCMWCAVCVAVFPSIYTAVVLVLLDCVCVQGEGEGLPGLRPRSAGSKSSKGSNSSSKQQQPLALEEASSILPFAPLGPAPDASAGCG